MRALLPGTQPPGAGWARGKEHGHRPFIPISLYLSSCCCFCLLSERIDLHIPALRRPLAFFKAVIWSGGRV